MQAFIRGFMKMAHRSTLPLVCFTLLVLGPLVNVQGRIVIRAPPGASTTGYYVIKLSDAVTQKQFNSTVKQVTQFPIQDITVYIRVEGPVLWMFTMSLSYEEAEMVKGLDNVEYVQEETYFKFASWGRDRIDQVSPRLDGRYFPAKCEAGDIYILDTGINYDHVEFQHSRALYSGLDAVDEFVAKLGLRAIFPFQRGRDIDGHGTYVASLAAGRTSGSAPKARVYSVRIGFWGITTESLISKGVNFAVARIKTVGNPAVISMSLGGPKSPIVENAVIKAHAMGVTVVVAAGNEADDACNYSPGRLPHVITVGGSDLTIGPLNPRDLLYRSTNGGRCVDIFAPGASVQGAGFPGGRQVAIESGTSLSAPLVSGVVAILLQQEPNLTPDQVKQRLIRDSLKNVIDFSRFDRRLRRTTPNRLLQIIKNNTSTRPPPTITPTPSTIPFTTSPPTRTSVPPVNATSVLLTTSFVQPTTPVLPVFTTFATPANSASQSVPPTMVSISPTFIQPSISTTSAPPTISTPS